MRYYCHNHQGKADRYIEALKKRRHSMIDDLSSMKLRVLLVDTDIKSRAGLISKVTGRGLPVLLYPHTAVPVFLWDGIFKPHPGVTAVFTIAQGHVDVMHAYGFRHKTIHPAGWTYCPQKNFEPHPNPKKVLFAPQHPNGGVGSMPHQIRQANSQAYHRLLMLHKAGDIELTVRFLHPLSWNGLWKEEGVTYVQGKPDQSTQEIDAADVVVARMNMLYLAVARGKPTLGYGEQMAPMVGYPNGEVLTVASWEKYRDIMAYPLDLLAHDRTASLINQACTGNDETAAWRERFIGEMFNEDEFADTVEWYTG